MWYTHVRFNFRKSVRALQFKDLNAETRSACICNIDAFILSVWSKCVTYVNILFLINIKRSGSKHQKDWNDVFIRRRRRKKPNIEFIRYFIEIRIPRLPAAIPHSSIFRLFRIVRLNSLFFSRFLCRFLHWYVFVLFRCCNMLRSQSCTFMLMYVCIRFVDRICVPLSFECVCINFHFSIYSSLDFGAEFIDMPMFQNWRYHVPTKLIGCCLYGTLLCSMNTMRMEWIF